jgi:hypothetical protein
MVSCLIKQMISLRGLVLLKHMDKVLILPYFYEVLYKSLNPMYNFLVSTRLVLILYFNLSLGLTSVFLLQNFPIKGSYILHLSFLY